MPKVRVALCQIECHPAIYASHIAFIEEPFTPKGGPSLSQLGTGGIDVQSLQTHNLHEYMTWQAARIRGILDFLGHFSPAPDLVLFPEGSIPIPLLPLLGEWSARTGATILAGSHTPQQTPNAKKHYAEVGVEKVQLNQMYKYGSRNILPLIRSGRVTLIAKNLSSVFEGSLVDHSSSAIPSLKPVTIEAEETKFELLPLICSEALQLHNVKRNYQVVGNIVYDTKPQQFQPFIQQQIHNKKIVLFCNDGAFGGTVIGLATDQRRPNWLGDAFPSGLPSGDSLIVGDIDLNAAAVEVGTSVPAQNFRLISLASIAYEHGGQPLLGSDLSAIRDLSDSSLRASELRDLLRNSSLNNLQRKRIERLAEEEARGVPSIDWWNSLAQDCLIRGIPPLRDLEAQLAANCSSDLLKKVPSLSPRSETASLLVSFLSECSKRSSGAQATLSLQSGEALAVVDRDREIKIFSEFLDSSTLDVLEISGLPEVGKSSAIKKALAQSGIGSSPTVRITDTSSADFIVFSILQFGGGLPKPPYEDPAAVVETQAFINALRSTRVLVLEKCHLLLEGAAWRDENLVRVLTAIIDIAATARCKIIIETRKDLPMDLSNPSARARLHIRGLHRLFGVSLFDAQLRRVGLSPGAIDQSKKEALVDRVGGHPVAIALAADALYEDGFTALMESLKQRRGFYFDFLEKLIRGLSLADDEMTVLQILCLARAPIARSVIFGSVTFPAAAPLRNLIALGAVEVNAENNVEIAGVLREYMNPHDLPNEIVAKFHEGASFAFRELVTRDPKNIAAAVEAEYHAALAGKEALGLSNLIDGSLASARSLFVQQKYEEAAGVLESILKKSESLDVLRLASQVEAKCGRFDSALGLARRVFGRNPQDTWLLSELAKTALTQYQEGAAQGLVDIARQAGVEDVSILIVESRLAIKRHDYSTAEKRLQRAVQLTERNPWPFYYLGKVYMSLGDIDRAIDILTDGEEFFYESESRTRNALYAIKTQLAQAYLFQDRLDLARPILEGLIEQDPSPEVIRTYAALTIKSEGIERAQEALKKFEEAPIRNRFDRCQLHLLYGLFYLGINNSQAANKEFAKAHDADKSNVYVMMRWARALFDLSLARHLESDESYKVHARDCASLVRKILKFDPDNKEGLSLLQSLQRRFSLDVR